MWRSDKKGNHFQPKTKKHVTGVQSQAKPTGVKQAKFLKKSDVKKTIEVPADPDAKVDVEIDINNTSGEESKVEDSSNEEKNSLKVEATDKENKDNSKC